VRFRTTIELGGKTATGMAVPASVVEALGKGKRPPVRVTLGGYTYRSTIAPMGGRFFIPVSAEVRSNANVEAGDEVDVEVELDTEPREVTVPPDLKEALQSDPEARARFDALSYSNQRRHVLSIEGAKTPETRRRRIDKTLAGLRGD
jgi:Bacteriocin-protection, YdeI or OmpD-Associated/Domain of unknown function (DUF1905)